MDVIGVGGIDFDDNIAPFSSRGMTTWVCEKILNLKTMKALFFSLMRYIFQMNNNV